MMFICGHLWVAPPTARLRPELADVVPPVPTEKPSISGFHCLKMSKITANSMLQSELNSLI